MTRPVLDRALAAERPAIRRALLAGLLVTVSSIGLAGTSAWLIVRAAQEPVILSLSVPMGLVQLFALAKAVGRYLERTQTHRAALGVMGHVRASVARIIEPLVPAGLGPRSSDVVDLMLRDVERVQDLLTAVAGPLLTSVVAGLMTVAVAGVIAPWTALILAGGLAVSAGLLPWLASRDGARGEQALDRVRAEMVTVFDRVARGGDEFVMSGASRALFQELDELERRYDRARGRRTATSGAVAGLGVVTSGLTVAAVLVATASALREGHLALSLLAVPALISVAALELVSTVAPSLAGLAGDRAALGRLEALSEVTAPVVDPTNSASVVAEASCELRGVARDFGGRTVLEEVATSIGPDDVVVLGGVSGGGKTTLARMIAKFLDPSRGELELGGTPYPSLTQEVVRGHVGFVDDEPHVFSTTLAGNLRVARPDASDDELRRALAIAGLTPLVTGMSDGLATRLGGASTGLSGGERRRLGVAREMLVGRGVVVVDEPTEGLDESTATTVMEAIVEHCRGRALLVISHREADHVRATRRLELRDGRLHEVAVDVDV